MTAERERVAALLDALRAAVDEGGFSSEQAARVAFLHLTRPERDGGLLPDEQRAILRLHVDELARHMVTDPDTRTLQLFATECVRTARDAKKKGRHPGAALRRPTLPARDDDVVRAAIYAESVSAKDDDDLVRRAVTRALREEKRSRRGFARVPLDDRDPLRDVLGLPRAGGVRLLRTDVRQHAAGLEGPLGDALRESARFLPSQMRRVLGEELAGLCRVLGFADAHRRRVLIGVSSSALAQEVAMRKPELLARLRAQPGFEKVKDVRFEIVDDDR